MAREGGGMVGKKNNTVGRGCSKLLREVQGKSRGRREGSPNSRE